MNVLRQGILDELRDSSATVEKIHAEMNRTAAQETVITATLQAIRTPSKDNIRRLGQVVGSTLKTDAPDWEQATEFVRDLEQLNDRDLAAMHLIWSVQHRQEAEPGRMHTDANRYTGEWVRVIGFAEFANRPDGGAEAAARFQVFNDVVTIASTFLGELGGELPRAIRGRD